MSSLQHENHNNNNIFASQFQNIYAKLGFYLISKSQYIANLH